MNGRKNILLFTPAPSYNSLPKSMLLTTSLHSTFYLYKLCGRQLTFTSVETYDFYGQSPQKPVDSRPVPALFQTTASKVSKISLSKFQLGCSSVLFSAKGGGGGN